MSAGYLGTTGWSVMSKALGLALSSRDTYGTYLNYDFNCTIMRAGAGLRLGRILIPGDASFSIRPPLYSVTSCNGLRLHVAGVIARPRDLVALHS